MESAAPPMAFPTVAGHTIIREIGGGGMARVFLARDESLGREVVVKVLSADMAEELSAERFAREVKLVAVLQEPHIIPVLSAGQTADARPWYTMPFVAGESLRARLNRGPVPLGEAVDLLRNVAQALAYAHAQGVVHRDIKPENILISSGTAVVADFGIAKALSAAKTRAPGGTITQIGTSLGTPAYIAPEQAIGDATADHRADIYSFGVMAYELVAGRHPFADRTSPQQLIAAHIATEPPPLARASQPLPEQLVDIVMRCVRKDPAQRPQTARELCERLASISASLTTGSSVNTGQTVQQRGRASRGLLIGALAVAGILVALAAIKPWQSRRGATATAAINTVAVLPFANLSGDAKDEYFSDGMTDDLAHALAALPSVRVAGRTSSYSFKGKHPTAQEVGKALNVAGVIDGSVTRSGGRLRIFAQLSSATDGLVLWSKTVDKQIADAFQVQDEVTREIVAAIAPSFAGQPVRTVADNRGTSDLEAYDLYLRGHFFWQKRGSANLRQAIDLFKQAIARDPRFARAHAGLAQAYVVLRTYDRVPADSMAALAIASADRALELDPSLADAYAAKGYALLAGVQLREAEAMFGRAIELEPSNPNIRHWHSINLSALGLLDTAIAEEGRAEAADPLSAVFANHQGLILTNAGRFDEARARFARALSLDSSYLPVYASLGFLHVYSGHPDSATYVLSQRPTTSAVRYLSTSQLGFAVSGRWREADSIARIIQDHGPAPYNLLVIALLRGETSAALDALETGLTARGGMIFDELSPGCDPLLEPLRNEARYKALMDRLGIRVCTNRKSWKFPRRR